MGNRVRPVPLAEASPEVKQLYSEIFGEGVDPTANPGTGRGDGPSHNGVTGDVTTTLALVPGLNEDHRVSFMAILRGENRPLDPVLRELAVLRTAIVSDCRFMYSQHCGAAKMFGVPEEKIAAIKGWASSDLFEPVERAVMAATDEIVGRRMIENDTFASLKKHLSDAAIAELVYDVAMYKQGGLFVRALHLEYDTDTTDRLSGVEISA